VNDSTAARVITEADHDWPAGFRDLDDPPARMFVRGVLPLDAIAVIGSRWANADACSFARALSAALSMPIVAGLAPGIDEAAHNGALDAAQPTVAYVGSGLAALEDPALADAIIAGGGAIASEYPPTLQATEWTRMRRDRLQAAHARAVVLVVSEAEGGAMHTLRYAKALRRPRFVLERDATGNAHAIAEGAFPVPWHVSGAAEQIRSFLLRNAE
jgi:DNA processing protein